jgi:UvrD/REP helicase N-terminal domain
MRNYPDEADRARALSDLDSTMLVEAAAGTGKTSLLAGRVALLLASGVHPRNIVAITFTELAAGELRLRVSRFVKELLSNKIPEDLRIALPGGLMLLGDHDRVSLFVCTKIAAPIPAIQSGNGGIVQQRAAWSPTAPICPACSGRRPATSTASSRANGLPICRCRRR